MNKIYASCTVKLLSQLIDFITFVKSKPTFKINSKIWKFRIHINTNRVSHPNSYGDVRNNDTVNLGKVISYKVR